MTRLIVIALFVCGMAGSMVGCTNTVRGLGRDFNNDTMQNYNSRTATNLDQ